VWQEADLAAYGCSTKGDEKVIAILAKVEHDTRAGQPVCRSQNVSQEFTLREGAAVAPCDNVILLKSCNQLIHGQHRRLS
jgi:hypothetical protein